MSVTNAISGLVAIGGMFLLGGGVVPQTTGQSLAALAVFLANINIFGGFKVTGEMLNLFRRPGDAKDYSWLYLIPAALFGGACLWTLNTDGIQGFVQAGYLLSSLLCIGAIQGLAAQATARTGNLLGVLGVVTGVGSALLQMGYSQEVLMQWLGLTGGGAAVGLAVASRVTALQLPQTVAALHALVGLAAVAASSASVLQDLGHLDVLHVCCFPIEFFFQVCLGLPC